MTAVYECAQCGDGTPGIKGSRACAAHYAEIMERLTYGRSPKTPIKVNKRDANNARAKQVAAERAEQKAAEVAAFVRQQDQPVKGQQLRARFPLRAIEVAVKSGLVRSENGGPAALRGYYAP